MAKKKVDNRIFNFNIVEFFKSGEKAAEGDPAMYIDENVLYVEDTPIGIKRGKYMVVNGDEIGSAEEARDELQQGIDKEITTSFNCLENVGIDLSKMEVIHSTQDLSKRVNRNNEDFKNFEKNVPQGATYRETRSGERNLITEKYYHRAGSMLIKYADTSYICGMDDDSYFVSKLRTNPRTVEAAFRSLKPKRVFNYEEESGKIAPRQGEWFFIPMPDMEADSMESNATLPLEDGEGNTHVAEHYEKSGDRHFVKGDIDHDEHNTMHLGAVLHEAVQSTALGSWSERGVD